MDDQADTEGQEAMHDGRKEGIDGKPLGHLAQLIHALGRLHPHDDHQNREEAAEQGVEEAVIDGLGLGEDADGHAQQERRDGRTLDAFLDDRPDFDFLGGVAGLLGEVDAGHHDGRHQRRNIHEGVQGRRPGLIGDLGRIQLRQHRRQRGAAHRAEQTAGGHGVRHADAWQFPQGVTSDEYDHDAKSHSRERREKDLGGVGVTNRDPASQADLHQQEEADELVDRIWNGQLAAKRGDDNATDQKAKCWRLQLLQEKP